MVQKPAVHIELREEEWAVVREGNKRATSTHPIQSEAAESGRNLARQDKTEFFLHAQDGQIREHRDYRLQVRATFRRRGDRGHSVGDCRNSHRRGWRDNGRRGAGRWRREPGNGDDEGHRAPGGKQGRKRR